MPRPRQAGAGGILIAIDVPALAGWADTEAGGANGNGVIYSLREDGHFEVLHTFSATNATTGANYDGANADNGVVLDGNKLFGIAIYGGNGSPAGYNNSGGTLYELKLDHLEVKGTNQPD